MGLKANGRLLHALPLRSRGGATRSFEVPDSNKSDLRNIYATDAGVLPSAAIPNGTLSGGSWVLPQKSGGISAYTSVYGTSDATGSAAAGKNGQADLSGVSDLSGIGALVSSAIATIAGTSIVSANVVALLNAIAALAASGDLSGTLLALGILSGQPSGTGSLVATPKALGELLADITPFTDLSPESLSAAVMDVQEIEAGYTVREAMRLILSALAGKVSGAGGSTVTIRDVNDLKDRIIAAVDSSGNRTAVTHDTTD